MCLTLPKHRSARDQEGGWWVGLLRFVRERKKRKKKRNDNLSAYRIMSLWIKKE